MGLDYWLVDNSVISNFALIGKLDFLKGILGEKLCIPEEVKTEFVSGVNKGIIPQTDINWLQVISRIKVEEELFERFCHRLGKGESACLSIAFNRKWKFFSDDVDARKTAQRLEVPVSGTIGILTYLVHKGHITLEDGNSMLRDMIKKGYYSPTDELDELLK